MKTLILTLAFAVAASNFHSTQAFAQLEENFLQAEVIVDKADLWSLPGYSRQDCKTSDPKSEACTSKKPDGNLVPDTRVKIFTDENGFPLAARNNADDSDVFSIDIGGEKVDVQFYRVQVNGTTGWMSSAQLSRPHKIGLGGPLSPLIEVNDTCDTKIKIVSPLAKLKKRGDAIKIAEAVDKQMPFGPLKSVHELDRYMCIHRSKDMSLETFEAKIAQFRKAGLEAEKAFKIPYSAIMCGMLVETRLFFDPNEAKAKKTRKVQSEKEIVLIDGVKKSLPKGRTYTTEKDPYQGLTQFGPALVYDLKQEITTGSYKKMWEDYSSRNSNVQFTDKAIRLQPDPMAPAAATGLAFRWIYDERMREGACNGCSTDGKNFTRKDIYMWASGYNYRPYKLKELGPLTPTEMLSTDPPPEETRNYMVYMENCMQSGHDKSFRETPAQIKELYNKQIASIQKQIDSKKGPVSQKQKAALKDKIAQLTNLRDTGINRDYLRNVAECNQKFPEQ